MHTGFFLQVYNAQNIKVNSISYNRTHIYSKVTNYHAVFKMKLKLSMHGWETEITLSKYTCSV